MQAFKAEKAKMSVEREQQKERPTKQTQLHHSLGFVWEGWTVNDWIVNAFGSQKRLPVCQMPWATQCDDPLLSTNW